MSLKKRALITGVTGQDGSYLAELLLKKKYQVFGLVKKDHQDLSNIPRGVNLVFGDLADRHTLKAAVAESKPDEVYNLAGISDLKTAFQFPEETMKINFTAVSWLLDECLKINPEVKFLQASSSEIFKSSRRPLTEKSPVNLQTQNPYAKAKMEADRYIKNYRKNKKVFACSAFLFNHESPRRPERFATRKITSTLVKIKRGLAKDIELGNLEAKRDWGFAGDYVEAMWLMLQQPKPQDFVIATGESHSIKEFIEIACGALLINISWRGKEMNQEGWSDSKVIVKINPQFYRPSEKYPKVGNYAKARTVLQWKPKTSLKQLVKMMVTVDLK